MNVELRSSSAPSEPARARSASSAISEASTSIGLLVRAAHDRHDEPFLGLHRDADVVAVEEHDRVPVEPRVELGELDERVRARLHDDREEPVERHVLEVALLDPGHGRHLTVGARHVLGDHAADSA